MSGLRTLKPKNLKLSKNLKPEIFFSKKLGFYRAAWNADAVYSDDCSVCPSVCLSVSQTRAL